ncbi:hypothetical protein J6590_100938, partial [Homalodisca vitripennis]
MDVPEMEYTYMTGGPSLLFNHKKPIKFRSYISDTKSRNPFGTRLSQNASNVKDGKQTKCQPSLRRMVAEVNHALGYLYEQLFL